MNLTQWVTANLNIATGCVDTDRLGSRENVPHSVGYFKYCY